MGLFDIFSDSGGKRAANQAYAAQKEGLKKGYKKAATALSEAKTEGLGYLDQGIEPYQGLLDQGQQGIDYYGRLLGLGGGDPGQMQSVLENIPGYQFALNQGIEAINRRANAAGMLNSGNADIDAINYAQGLASQNYFDYLNAVQPYFGLGQNAAAGIQSGYTNKANLAADTGQQLANYGWMKHTGIGQAGADRAMNIYNAEQAAGGNLWNAILGIGGALAGAFGA